MKRDFLKALGLSDEQIEKTMASNGLDVTAALEKGRKDGSSALELQLLPTIENLKSDNAELEKLRKENMSTEELLKQAQADAKLERGKYLQMQSEAKATVILTKAGMTTESIATILPGIIGEDVATSEKRATEYVNVFTAAIETAVKAKEAELLKNTNIDPPAGGGNPAGNADIQKKMDEARTNGDAASLAYYTRLAQQGG